MNRWYKLSQSAAKSALKYRLEIGLGLDSPCDIYETISSRGIELQFVDIPSLEGMCLQEPEVTRICVTADRPWGRQRFTAAHELGHYVLDHGSQVDAAIEAREGNKGISDEEILADGFARFFLMPRPAVMKAFSHTTQFDAMSVFKASCYLGVSYESLVRQLCLSLKLINGSQEKSLLRYSRQEIAQMLLGNSTFKRDVWPLDDRWRNRVLHLQIGDAVLGVSPINSEGTLQISRCHGGSIVESTGDACVSLLAGGEVTIRASKRSYIGFYDYRYLPE